MSTKLKSGSEKRRLKEKKMLVQAGSDPKQMKLSFSNEINIINVYPRSLNEDKVTVSFEFEKKDTDRNFEPSLPVPSDQNKYIDTSAEKIENEKCTPETSYIDEESTIQESSPTSIGDVGFFIMPDHKSSVEVKLAFLKNHPIQPVSLDLDNKLPFDPNKVYFQVTTASSLLQANLKNDIGSCININVKKVHLKEVECRRLVIKRLIDIITFIGRQGLSYRVLNEHIQNSIHLSNKRKEKESCNIKNANQVHGHGRGSLVTFLSKTFINKLILVIGKIIQNKIINDIKQAKLFSIMVDSTQDVSVLDQLAICVRYVLDNEVHENLFKLVVVYDSSGKGLYDLISSEFHKLTLDISKVIGCSFDGAANMKGPYNGLQAHLKNNNPLCVYTHCVGHVLNLVMVDSSECCVNAEFLFGLVQQSSTFLLDSYKRMKVWSELTKKTIQVMRN
ncbi:hypothetical protein AGLY_016980 [Aphis glycines]|uniref:DUF4371 domain-containing protein n=1 Tax=Aphis glycines TaxID=307491 RepID=A0A6G0SY83_APHGL|nr:hypothetical protein AGLY_016980 [Aphis glycines]